MENPISLRGVESFTRRNWSDLNIFHLLVLLLVVIRIIIQVIKDFSAIFLAVRRFFATEDVNFDRSIATEEEDFNDDTCQLPWLLHTQKESTFTYEESDGCFTELGAINVVRARKFIVEGSGYAMLDTTLRMTLENIESYCLGWKGWILVVENNGNMYLCHVFSQTQIKLPNKNNLGTDYILVNKATLSSDPLSDDDYTLMITCSHSLVAFWRPGYHCFHISKSNIDDMIFYNGLFYSIDTCGLIVKSDVKGAIFSFVTKHPLHLDDYHHGFYIVESLGKLLIVGRSNKKTGPKFRVFTLVQDELLEISNLGNNRAIFIGLNTSFSVDASEIRGCRANRIYFTDDQRCHVAARFSEHHMGVYNVLDGKVEYSRRADNLPCGRSHPFLWFTPNFA